MPRPITAAGRAALRAGTIRPVYLLEVLTDEGALRISTLNIDIEYDGQTWSAGPDEWELPEGIPIPQALTPEAFEMIFDGGHEENTGSFIGALVTRTWHQRPVRFFGLLLNTDDASVIDQFYEWRGRLDRITTQLTSAGPAQIRVSCESGVFRALERNVSTVSPNDQKRRDATDTMFLNMPMKQGQDVPYGVAWSKVPGYSSGGSSGGGGGFNDLDPGRNFSRYFG